MFTDNEVRFELTLTFDDFEYKNGAAFTTVLSLCKATRLIERFGEYILTWSYSAHNNKYVVVITAVSKD